MPCKFKKVPLSNQEVTCKPTVALPELKTATQIDFKLTELRELVCDGDDQSECPAHKDLNKFGLSSRYRI